MENGDLLFKSLFVGRDYFTNDIDKMRPCLSGALTVMDAVSAGITNHKPTVDPRMPPRISPLQVIARWRQDLWLLGLWATENCTWQ